jgi:hypothetical protein
MKCVKYLNVKNNLELIYIVCQGKKYTIYGFIELYFLVDSGFLMRPLIYTQLICQTG